MYQQNPLGAMSIDIFNSAYHNFAAPILRNLQGPYSIIAPYVQKADEIGNSTLETVDNQVPAIKKTDMETLKSRAFDVAHFPFKVASESKDYVFSTYNDEYNKTGGNGLITTGKAILSTELRITADAIHKVADMLGPRGKQMEEQFEHLAQMGAEKASQVKKTAEDVARDSAKKVDQLGSEGKKMADHTAGDLKKSMARTAQDGQNMLHDAKQGTYLNVQHMKRTAQDKSDHVFSN